MKRTVEELARALGRTLDETRAERLVAFGRLVDQWNARTNLTAARTPEALSEVLFADALMLADGVLPEGARVVDVGSGAGAPVIPLLMLRTDLTATLVEPLRKRVAFLRIALGALDLVARARVVESKVDPRAPQVAGGPFDVAMSRATLAPSEWLSVGLRLAPRVIVLTAEEAPEAPAGTAARSVTYTLPGTGAPRRATVYDRT